MSISLCAGEPFQTLAIAGTEEWMFRKSLTSNRGELQIKHGYDVQIKFLRSTSLGMIPYSNFH